MPPSRGGYCQLDEASQPGQSAGSTCESLSIQYFARLSKAAYESVFLPRTRSISRLRWRVIQLVSHSGKKYIVAAHPYCQTSTSLPFPLTGSMASTASFGKALREQHFLFEKDYVPLNHGSFGAFPRCVRDRMRELADRCEASPDTYIRYDFFQMIEESRKATAEILQCDPNNLVFLPNATTAGNTILRSMVWEKGDVILTLDISSNSFYMSWSLN